MMTSEWAERRIRKNRFRRGYRWSATGILLLGALQVFPAAAQGPSADEAAKAALTGNSDEEGKAYEPKRPAHMPDLTKGDELPVGKNGPILWNMGPTGIVGIKNGGFAGDQVFVVAVEPGSPADGKVLPGDVVLGVEGKDFVIGGHLGVAVGNAIIRAEEEAGKGLFTMHLWRDRNWPKRNAAKDVAGIDIEELFRKAEEDADLYEWKDDAGKTAAIRQMGFDEFPIDAVETNVTLLLKVMGTYSDTSPWDCPVAAHIREDAWKVLAAGFRPDKRGRVRGNWPAAIALTASGRPEYLKIVHDWVRTQKLCRDLNAKVSLDDLTYRGMQSWHHGFGPLELAIYYDATGDDYVLPELRYRAIMAALGQNGGGSWGHTFAFPEFNGGQLHGMNPGYGAMDNAGTRCFFLLTLAKKAGIEDPEIDAAIERASRFFGSYVDKGCVPYGYHSPWPSDDSNGKNYGAAYAFYVLGKVHQAKYFAMLSNHASFSRRGGHGSPTLWYYTPLSANICGPRGVMASMRNLRWFYTLSRRYDGSFVFQGEQAGIGGKGMRNPTATLAMFYSAPLKNLIITGKDADKSCWFTDKELDQLLVSARPQVKDPTLLARIGKPWKERGTDELIDLLDHFYMNMRRDVAKELARRVAAGEQAIVPKVTALLKSDESRYRDGACRTLIACGKDAVRAAMAQITPLLRDPAEFVRMTAVAAIGVATEPGDPHREVLLLKAAADNYPGMSTDNANVRTAVRNVLFPGGRHGSGASASKLTTDPFKAGYDADLVRRALAAIITMDPGGMVPWSWSRDTLLRLAGPITFVAEQPQLNDAMFGGARLAAGQRLISEYGYRELIEACAEPLYKRERLRPDIRRRVNFKRNFVDPAVVEKYRGACRELLPMMKRWLSDTPLASAVLHKEHSKRSDDVEVLAEDMIRQVEADQDAAQLPTLSTDVDLLFRTDLEKAATAADRIARCRAELADPGSRFFFRQLAAMDQLVAMAGSDAIADLVPYLGHDEWRLRKHARELALQLVKGGAAGPLIEAFPKTGGATAAGILAVLTDSGAGTPGGLALARQALKQPDPAVRKAAVQALAALGGRTALPEVLAFMRETTDPDDLWGCEQALLSWRDDPAQAKRVREAAMAMLPKSGPECRRSLYWVLAQLGGPESMAALEKAGATKDEHEFADIVMALSYAPERAADQVLLDLAKQAPKRAGLVAGQCVRRMVIGPDDIGKVPDDVKLDLAGALLKLDRNLNLIRYLGGVRRGRSVQILLDCMRKGPEKVTSTSAESIVAVGGGMTKAPEAERKMAAEGLRNVIEYIEVVHLRGGVSAHLNKDDAYADWKMLQARAGKALTGVYKPESAPPSTFDDMDLDL